jgi:sugar lactone lactonase YvrE
LLELEARLCLSNGPYLLVTSYGNDSVTRYDELTGDPMPSAGHMDATFIGQHESPLSTPLDLLYTPDGDLLVDSAEDNDVLRYDGQTGQFLSLFVPSNTQGLQGPTGMIFSPDGNSFFLASVANHLILRFDYANGGVSNPTTFISDPAINFPAALVFGPDGNLYVGSLNNSSVERYDGTTGDPLPAPGQSGADFVPSGSGGLNRAAGVVFGPDGNLYVASETSNEIMRYDGTTGDPLPADGQPGAVFVPQDAGLQKPAGMIFGPGDTAVNDLYVVSIDTSNIFRFDGDTGDPKGEFIPAGSGGLSAPRDLTFGNTDPSTLDYVPPSTAGRHHTATHLGGVNVAPLVQVALSQPVTTAAINVAQSSQAQERDPAAQLTTGIDSSTPVVLGSINTASATAATTTWVGQAVESGSDPLANGWLLS